VQVPALNVGKERDSNQHILYSLVQYMYSASLLIFYYDQKMSNEIRATNSFSFVFDDNNTETVIT
jgi:hypothetical protein